MQNFRPLWRCLLKTNIGQDKYSVLASIAYERIRTLNHELKVILEEARNMCDLQAEEIQRLRAENEELRKELGQ